MHVSTIVFSTLFTLIQALTITSPSGSIDPTQPITVVWTSSPSDPSTFDLVLDQPDGGLTSNKVIATGVSTSAGSYIVSANAVMSYGSSFVIKARSPSGDTLATSPSFDLSIGSATTVDGQLSAVSTYTFTGPTNTNDAGTAQNTLTASSAQGPAASSTGAAQSQNSTGDSSSTTDATNTSTGFSTSTTSRANSSSTRSSSSTSASATTSQNAQPRLGSSSQIAFSAAGILAGLAALLA